MIPGAVGRAAAVVALCCGLSAVALGAASDTVRVGAASMSASPNPVPAGPGAGTTTLTWDAGAEAEAEVYVQEGTGAENLFARGKVGTKSAPWIGNAPYVFRLYAGTEHKTVLASVTVTRSTSPAPPSGGTSGAQPAGSPSAGDSGTPPANAGSLALGYFLLGAGTTGLVWFVRWRSSRSRDKDGAAR